MQDLPLSWPPQPGPRLNRKVLAALMAGGLVVVASGVVLYAQWRGGGGAAPVVEEAAPAAVPFPKELRERPRAYVPAPVEPAKPTPPVAAYVTREGPAPVIQPQSLLPTLPFPAPAVPPAPVPVSAPAGASTPPPGSTPAKPEKKKPTWGWLAKAETEHEAPPVAQRDEEREKLAALGAASQLIKPTTWAIPAYPLKTIYRSQTLIGRLAQAVNSDIPGQVKIELIFPLYDKFGYDQLILDKGTLIIASQEGKPQYGARRLPLKLEQAELLSGEIVTFKAMIGDQEGANGVGGAVNNHYKQLVAATILSAVLNIGVRTATGTPTGFYQNPAQEAARDIGQDVQGTTKSVIERELKLAPTIEIPAGTNVTVNLGENITFSRKPVVIR